KEVGAGVSSVRPGDKVMAFTTYGAFAEEVKTEAARLLPIPDGMDFESAAAFVLTYGTSDHALRDRGALRAGETLLVLVAAGGVPKRPLNLALLKGAAVVGVFWGDFARREPKAFAGSIAQLGVWFREGKLRPHVSKIYPLEKAADALRLMAARQVKGKVVLAL